LREAERSDKTILDVWREQQISEQTFHRWKKEFGMMEVDQAKQLKELQKENARLKRMLAEYTREYLCIHVDRRINACKFRRIVSALIGRHGAPEHIRSDNGSEFIERGLRRWLAEKKIKALYIEPGSPWQNGYVESFNARFREECLNR